MKYVPFIVIATLLLFFLVASLSTKIPADITNYELQLVSEDTQREFPNSTQIQKDALKSVKEKLEERQSRRLKYLVSAYLVIWGVLMGYVLYLSHRQTKLKEDIEFLKSLKR